MRRYIVLLTLIVLSGCASKEKEHFDCPQTGFVSKADTAVFFNDAKAIVAQAAIDGFTGNCSFKKKGEVDLELSLPFVVQKGPAGADLKDKELSYFVAVVSPEEEILQRREFTTRIVFDNKNKAETTEELVLKVPLKQQKDAARYKVVTGFSLTPDQLLYNEKGPDKKDSP